MVGIYRLRDGSVPDISVSHRGGVDNSFSRIEGNIWGEGCVYDFQLLRMCGGTQKVARICMKRKGYERGMILTKGIFKFVHIITRIERVGGPGTSRISYRYRYLSKILSIAPHSEFSVTTSH